MSRMSRSVPLASLLLASLLLSLLLSACGGEASAPGAGWSATIAFQADVKLGGCDVGDLDALRPGNEIAAVAVDGRVFLVRPEPDGWSTKTIATLPGEGIQCSIGDADPTRPGNELVVVGMASGTENDGGKGAVHLVYRDGDAWATEVMFEDTALVHGVDIGDLDPHHPGNEVVVTGFSRRTTLLVKDEGGWTARSSEPLAGAGKNVLVLHGVAMIANTSAALVGVEVLGEGEAPREAQRGALGVAQARLGGGAKDLVVACDDGSLRIATPDDAFPIYRQAQKLRGAVLADLDPFVDGEEAATAGYGKELTLLYRGANWREPWTPVTLWRDTGAFHHVAAGELLAKGHGLEIVGVGYSGRVIVAMRSER